MPAPKVLSRALNYQFEEGYFGGYGYAKTVRTNTSLNMRTNLYTLDPI